MSSVPPNTSDAVKSLILAKWLEHPQQQQQQTVAPLPFQVVGDGICKPVEPATPAEAAMFPEVVAHAVTCRDIAAGEVFFVEPLFATSIALLRSGRYFSNEGEEENEKNGAMRKRFHKMLGISLDGDDGGNHQIALLRAWRFADVIPERQSQSEWMEATHDTAEPSWHIMNELCAALSASSCPGGDAEKAAASLECLLVQLPPLAAQDSTGSSNVVRFVLFATAAIAKGQRCRAQCFQRVSTLPGIRSVLFDDKHRSTVLEATVAAAKQFLAATSALASEPKKRTALPRSVTSDASPARISKNKLLLFFSDSNDVINSIGDSPRYVQVQDPQRADIVYLVHTPFKSASDFPAARFISSFPEERCFLDKAALAKTVRSALGYPVWLPRSFDSETELHIFCGAFQLFRQQQQLWIAKSRSLTRGMGHLVLAELPWLLRAPEAIPRVICEYVERPVLVGGRKFDMRLYILVSSLNGEFADSEVYLCNRLFPRVSGQPYSVDRSTLHSYDTHFTLPPGTATPEEKARLMPQGPAFEAAFDAEHGAGCWGEKVMPGIRRCLLELFSNIPLVGGEVLAKGSSSADASDVDAAKQYLQQRRRFRAVYGCDLMVQQDASGEGFSPVLLEVTFAPDCRRPVAQIPGFFGHVFDLLFRGETNANFDKL